MYYNCKYEILLKNSKTWKQNTRVLMINPKIRNIPYTFLRHTQIDMRIPHE